MYVDDYAKDYGYWFPTAINGLIWVFGIRVFFKSFNFFGDF